MPIMSYADWIAGTNRGIWTPRSTKLQAIDAALMKYEQSKSRPDLVVAKTALNDWIAAKGIGWKANLRNKNHTVEELQQQINSAVGGGFAVTPFILQQKKQALVAPPPVQMLKHSLSSTTFATLFAKNVKNQVHKRWTSLTADQRATGMHKALADLFPSLDNMPPAPGLSLELDLGGDAGQFDFTTWHLKVASKPFGSATQPSKDDFVDAAKTIYHEGRHCEQWFHMARYASSGGKLTAQDVADRLDIPVDVAKNALGKKMQSNDAMYGSAKKWYDSVYDGSGREITLAALKLKQTGNNSLLQQMRQANHQRYSKDLPEEADAWGTEALLDTAYVWP